MNSDAAGERSDTYLRVRDIVGDRSNNPPIPGLLPISKSQWWSMVKDQIAPQPLRLSPGVTVWRLRDVLDFVERRAGDESGQEEGRGKLLTKKRLEKLATTTAQS